MRTLLALLLAAIVASPAAADPFDEFRSRARSELIKPFALDLGGIIGATEFTDGRALGFPGFEAGLFGATQFKPDRDNRILRDAGVKAFGLPVLHAAVGLPLKIDVAAHGIPVDGGQLLGAGVRYGIYKSGLVDKFIPNVGVSAWGDVLNHEFFSADHYALDAGASWNLPIFAPFAGIGMDYTEVKVRSAAVAGVNGLKESARGVRYRVGTDITPLPMVRLRVAYLVLHGIPGASVALGVKF